MGGLKLFLRPLSFLRSTQYAKYDAREKRLATKLQKMDKRAAFFVSILLAPFLAPYYRRGVPTKIPASPSAVLWIKEETLESSESWSDYESLDICYLFLMYDYCPCKEALTRAEANKVLEAVRRLPLISKRTKFVWLISQAIRRRPMHLGVLNAIPVIDKSIFNGRHMPQV